jgi:heat-inducible transcriptional repressor
VRNELTPAPLPDEVLRQIDERLLRSAHDVEELIHEASRLLSDLTRQLGLAVSVSLDRHRLAGLELASIEPGRSLLVLTLGGGVVRTLLLELENPLERGELDDVTAVLRERLVGLDVSQVRERLAFDPELVRDTAVRIVTRAAMASWARPSATTLYSAGAGNVASQPEFADGRQLGALLRLIESGPPLDRLMIDGVEGQPAVRVALDEDLALNGCSLVSYPLPGANRAGVGVLGPLRMDYARVVSVVDAVGSRVAGVL